MLKQAIPLHLVLNTNLHQLLWLFIRIRSKYKNPILYKFNYTKHSKLLGVSHTCLRKYIPKMIELGWCSLHHGNLCFRSIDKLKNHLNAKGKWKKSKCVLIPVRETKAEQISELRCAVLNKNLHEQAYMIKQKIETVNKCVRNQKISPKQYKKIREVGGIENYEKSLQAYTTLSNKRIGILFNRSTYTGKRLQKVFNQMGLIVSIPKTKLVKRNVQPFEVKYYSFYGIGYIYNQSNKCLYRRTANEIKPTH